MLVVRLTSVVFVEEKRAGSACCNMLAETSRVSRRLKMAGHQRHCSARDFHLFRDPLYGNVGYYVAVGKQNVANCLGVSVNTGEEFPPLCSC